MVEPGKIRTPDLLRAMQALYQLSYGPQRMSFLLLRMIIDERA